jgi:hypothetical protein
MDPRGWTNEVQPVLDHHGKRFLVHLPGESQELLHEATGRGRPQSPLHMHIDEADCFGDEPAALIHPVANRRDLRRPATQWQHGQQHSPRPLVEWEQPASRGPRWHNDTEVRARGELMRQPRVSAGLSPKPDAPSQPRITSLLIAAGKRNAPAACAVRAGASEGSRLEQSQVDPLVLEAWREPTDAPAVSPRSHTRRHRT